MSNEKDSLYEYFHASECRRFEMYLQYPDLRYFFDEIESESIPEKREVAFRTNKRRIGIWESKVSSNAS